MSSGEVKSVRSGADGGRRRWGVLPGSVFTKLVAIVVAMAVGLLALVMVFFWFIAGPNLHASIDEVLQDYTRRLAASSPDLATANQLKARLNLETRYAGPAGSWSTASDLPEIAVVQPGGAANPTPAFPGLSYHVVPAPDGGAYLFAWSLGARANAIHSAAITTLLVMMVVVVVMAYLALKWLLAPLRGLNDGVARLGGGELDVVLPTVTRDEFGRLTEAFNGMVGRVRAMIGARDQLLLDVSHELRSPLTRVRVALELLPESPQRAGMVADLSEMERMITELLELERLRSSRGLQIARRDLLPILRDVAASFQAGPPGVRVIADARELPVDIDEEKVRTVVRNLLENAVKYSRPRSRPIELSATQEGETVVVRVTDDGLGIPESEAENVFEPFFRVDRSRSKHTGGYGLGLSICKRVMQGHGGDIGLERGRSAGASFVLTFPTREKTPLVELR